MLSTLYMYFCWSVSVTSEQDTLILCHSGHNEPMNITADLGCFLQWRGRSWSFYQDTQSGFGRCRLRLDHCLPMWLHNRRYQEGATPAQLQALVVRAGNFACSCCKGVVPVWHIKPLFWFMMPGIMLQLMTLCLWDSFTKSVTSLHWLIHTTLQHLIMMWFQWWSHCT